MIRLDSIVFTYLYAVIVFLTFEGNMFRGILGDPGADKGGEGKCKPAEKYIWNEEK